MPNKKISFEVFEERARKTHGDTYKYIRESFGGMRRSVKIICKTHGEFKQNASNHINGTKCPKCNLVTYEDFKRRGSELHNNKYTYSSKGYINSRSYVTIDCPEHGSFIQKVSSHLLGHGCPDCGYKKMGEARSATEEDFIAKAKEVHGDAFGYGNTVFKSYQTKVIITCPIHGDFQQSPLGHITGSGCKKCAMEALKSRKTKGVDYFKEQCSNIHDDSYKLKPKGYRGYNKRVVLECEEHGEFSILPGNLIYKKQGCPKCAVPHTEKYICNFLDDIAIPYKVRDRDFLQGKELDIFIPEKKLAIEVNGLYWHSDRFKDKNYHLDKTEECEARGFKLIHIFEDELNFKVEIVKSRIRNIIGKTSNKIYARTTEVKEVCTKDKTKFLSENHIQGAVGSKVNLGLFFGKKLVAIMTFGALRKNLGQSSKDDHWELLRFCNKLNTNVVGGASKLLKHFERNYKPKEIISYADRRWSQGGLYKALEFELETNTAPNYYYIIKGRRENRFKYRKNKLIDQGFNPLKTERQIMEEQGYRRIYDCGNLKYKKNF